MKRQLARNLRKSSSEAERVLRYNLRNRLMKGYKFRRQYAVGPFIVDFVCLEKRLIIEVDGGQHAETVVEDGNRTTFLNKQGYTVVRFWNNEVLQETKSVLQVILSRLEEGAPPHPDPLPQGGERG